MTPLIARLILAMLATDPRSAAAFEVVCQNVPNDRQIFNETDCETLGGSMVYDDQHGFCRFDAAQIDAILGGAQ